MLRPVQITVIGSGAIGGTVGAHLVRSGHDVLFCDTDEAHVAAINAHGLRIEGPVEAFTVPARAVLPQDLPPVIDRAVLAVKSHHTAAAAELLRDRLADDGYVLSLQNGLTAEAISAAVGPGRVLVGFVNFGADYLEPGVVLQGNVAAFRVGEPPGRSRTGSARSWPPSRGRRPPTTSPATCGPRRLTAPCCSPPPSRTCRSPTRSETLATGR